MFIQFWACTEIHCTQIVSERVGLNSDGTTGQTMGHI